MCIEDDAGWIRSAFVAASSLSRAAQMLLISEEVLLLQTRIAAEHALTSRTLSSIFLAKAAGLLKLSSKALYISRRFRIISEKTTDRVLLGYLSILARRLVRVHLARLWRIYSGPLYWFFMIRNRSFKERFLPLRFEQQNYSGSSFNMIENVKWYALLGSLDI